MNMTRLTPIPRKPNSARAPSRPAPGTTPRATELGQIGRTGDHALNVALSIYAAVACRL